ncbi:glycerate kinase [Nakamurella sp.]|uniref:glycerate kinase n=1 Tax=Nakamurella sp. TaxID=1869182 RepID=UPI003783E6ED
MKILIAPDKFKGSMRASDVAARVAAGISSVSPDAEVIAVPVADGGDGTLDAAVAAGFDLVPVTVGGPTGEPVDSGYARRAESAVIELADACGLVRLPGGVLAPLTASSAGFGQVIAAALDAGCRRLILAIGGSASTDGGAGMLTALGVRVRDADGADLAPGGGGLEQVASVDLTQLHPALAGAEVVLASDVDNPLLGDHGAAAVYGPQKGATPDDVARLDGALRAWSSAVARALNVSEQDSGHPAASTPGAGAAGGVGFAAIAVLRATARPGIDLMLELTGLRDDLAGADLVVTGEGSLDEQTLHGKAPAGVAAAARTAGVPVVTVSGRNLLSDRQLAAAGIRKAYALTDIESDVQRCMTDPGPLLESLGRAIASDFN